MLHGARPALRCALYQRFQVWPRQHAAFPIFGDRLSNQSCRSVLALLLREIQNAIRSHAMRAVRFHGIRYGCRGA